MLHYFLYLSRKMKWKEFGRREKGGVENTIRVESKVDELGSIEPTDERECAFLLIERIVLNGDWTDGFQHQLSSDAHSAARKQHCCTFFLPANPLPHPLHIRYLWNPNRLRSRNFHYFDPFIFSGHPHQSAVEPALFIDTISFMNHKRALNFVSVAIDSLVRLSDILGVLYT